MGIATDYAESMQNGGTACEKSTFLRVWIPASKMVGTWAGIAGIVAMDEADRNIRDYKGVLTSPTLENVGFRVGLEAIRRNDMRGNPSNERDILGEKIITTLTPGEKAYMSIVGVVGIAITLIGAMWLMCL